MEIIMYLFLALIFGGFILSLLFIPTLRIIDFFLEKKNKKNNIKFRNEYVNNILLEIKIEKEEWDSLSQMNKDKILSDYLGKKTKEKKLELEKYYIKNYIHNKRLKELEKEYFEKTVSHEEYISRLSNLWDDINLMWDDLSFDNKIQIQNEWEIYKLNELKEQENKKRIEKKRKDDENKIRLENEIKAKELKLFQEKRNKEIEIDKRRVLLLSEKKEREHTEKKDQIKRKILESLRKKELETEAIKELIEAGLIDNNYNSGKNTRENIPTNVKIAVWHRDKESCVNCLSVNDLEFDHIIPVSKGGANSINNIQLLCRSCNRAKSNKII